MNCEKALIHPSNYRDTIYARIKTQRSPVSASRNTIQCQKYFNFQPLRPYATFAAVVVALVVVVVVDTRLTGSWHVPEREPVVMQAYGRQQERVATLQDTREESIRNHLDHCA